MPFRRREPAFITKNADVYEDAEPKVCQRGCRPDSSVSCDECRFNYALVQYLRIKLAYARRPLLKDKAVLAFALVLFYASVGLFLISLFRLLLR